MTDTTDAQDCGAMLIELADKLGKISPVAEKVCRESAATIACLQGEVTGLRNGLINAASGLAYAAGYIKSLDGKEHPHVEKCFADASIVLNESRPHS